MRTQIRTDTMRWLIALLLLLPSHPTEGGVAPATLDQHASEYEAAYDQESSQRRPVNWAAVWGAVREFQAGAYANLDGGQFSGQLASPQPLHYLQGAPGLAATTSIPTTPFYGAPYGGPFYGYGLPYSTWFWASHRFPWWSLIPLRTHQHGHDRNHAVHQHDAHQQHHDARGHPHSR